MIFLKQQPERGVENEGGRFSGIYTYDADTGEFILEEDDTSKLISPLVEENASHPARRR
ncbi:MAG: hypothetical protein LBK75_08440 [Oscillospiraceae bacterium]|jgi:hypothetical protein|nr:hypothetical protein [Oscillospiraceae bacterium]